MHLENIQTEQNTEVFQKELDSLTISESRIIKSHDMRVRHFHDTIELYILLEGTRYFFIDKKIHVIKEGTAVVIPPGQIHKTSTYGDNSKHRRFLFQFSREKSEGMISSVFPAGFDEFSQKYNGPAIFRPKQWEQVLLIISRIKNEFENEEPNIPVIRALSHEALFMYAGELDHIRSINNDTGDSTSLVSDVHNSIQKVIEYLNENYMDEILIDDLAKKFFISRAYLTRNFKQVTGVTIVQYLTVVRVRNACMLLKDTNESISEISEKCGYTNTTYFENVFRRLRGVSPGKYRKVHSKNKDFFID
ncbi:MAG: AraC family transcriptional regulator [Butyrivibrio sp.]|nr:AraC family transcriptional regulator [Butyrivibrio sp.]